MKLNKAKYTIELDEQELRDLAFALKRALLESIEDHYNKLQQDMDGESVFDEQEKTEVCLLKELSMLSGIGIYENFEYMKKKAFTDRRKERESKSL